MRLKLDRLDTQILKGLAILAIAFHNFFHIVSPAQENEFSFNPTYFFQFIHASLQPDMAIQAFFSFFGHFGVNIFIFLSAYGLARSQWENPSSWRSFFISRCSKLYPAIGLVLIPWLFVQCRQFGPVAFLGHNGLHLILMLLGVSTLVPGFGLPPVGPWWFIPYILQFYALFPLLRRFTVRLGWQGLALLALDCLLVTHLINPYLQPWSIDLLTTPFGHMPCICLGIIAARYRLHINAALALGAGTVLILGSAYETLWPLTFLSSVVVVVWVYLKARPILRQSELLASIGASSLLIFLLNGIVRIPFVLATTTHLSQLWMGFASIVTTLLAASVIQWLYPPVCPQRELPIPEPLSLPAPVPAKICLREP